MKYRKVKKYATGTAIKGYMEDPYSELQQHKINLAKATHEAETNPWVVGLKTVGNMAMQYGLQQGGFGESGAGQAANSMLPMLANMEFAFGGEVDSKKKPGKPNKKSIKVLQKRLKEEGLYEGKIDGIFGPGTQKAYEQFETNASESGQKSGVVPLHIKSLFNDVGGDKNSLTRESLSDEELEALQNIVRANLKKGKNTISYDDYNTDELPSAKGNKPKTEGKLNLYDKLTDPNYKLKTTLGQANIVVTPSDTLVVDSYDFNDAKKDKGSLDNYFKNLKENPSLYNAARGLGTNFGSADGEGASAIINTNADETVEAQPGPVSAFLNDIFGSDMRLGFAYGGNIPNVPVEIEGEEVGEMPDGTMFEAEGPSHENGGIDIALPEGTEMYSKRIKVDGVTMADRKKQRKKKEMTFEDLLEMNGTDNILKNSLKRTKQVNAKQEELDTNIQDTISSALNPQPVQEFKDGGTVMGNFLRSIFGGKPPQEQNPLIDYDKIDEMLGGKFVSDNASLSTGMLDSDEIPGITDFSYADGILPGEKQVEGGGFLDKIFGGDNPNGGLTFGDAVSMGGNLISTFGPYFNTLKNRAEDTPNINAFENYGVEGLQVLDDTKQYVEQQKDENLKDLELSRNAAIRRGRNSARGVNTQRALDLATEQSVNNSQSDIYNAFTQQMMSILSQQAQMENQQDSVVMQGEQNRDLADRQDNDNFYSQLAQNIAGMGEGLQETGKDLNSVKQRKVMMNLVNQLSKYGITVDNNGNLTTKKSS